VFCPIISVLQTRAYFTTNNDRSFLVVNAVGLDRPGIVSDMTKLVTDANGSVGESRALKLGDHFTLMMLCNVPGENEERLRQVFDQLRDLHITTFKTRDPSVLELHQKVGCKFFFLSAPHFYWNEYEILISPLSLLFSLCLFLDEGHFKLSGADNPGIMYKVTSLLAKYGLNISQLKTADEDAPFGGTTLFLMEGIVSLSKDQMVGFNADQVRQELVSLGDSLNCDVTLEDVKSDEASSEYLF